MTAPRLRAIACALTLGATLSCTSAPQADHQPSPWVTSGGLGPGGTLARRPPIAGPDSPPAVDPDPTPAPPPVASKPAAEMLEKEAEESKRRLADATDRYSTYGIDPFIREKARLAPERVLKLEDFEGWRRGQRPPPTVPPK